MVSFFVPSAPSRTLKLGLMLLMKISSRLPRIPITALLLATFAWWSPAEAELATPDQEFLDTHIPLIDVAVSEDPEGITSTVDALEATGRLLTFRQESLWKLHSRVPLTTFDGIATQDAFDHEVVKALADIMTAAATADTTFPVEHSALFNEVMGPFPDLGNAPAPFMILGLAEMAINAADSLWSDPRIPQAAVAKLATHLIQAGTTVYAGASADAFATAQSSSMREGSVVVRLRCPKDGGTYRINTLRNKVYAEGDIHTLYYLQCDICAEPALLEFPKELTSKLNKMADRQKLKTEPRGTRPTDGLDP